MMSESEGKMGRTERQEHLLRLVSDRGTVYLHRAAKVTGASIATIRRDFAELAERGSVKRLRGAIQVPRREGDLPFSLRRVQHAPEKRVVAAHAAKLVRTNDVLFIDGGTTTFHLCLFLPSAPLRIVTNSLRLAAFLEESAQLRGNKWETYLTGGYLQPGSQMLTGPGTLHSLDFYQADWAFLSIGGVMPDGFYNTSEAVVETERKMIQRAERAVVLADSSKLGKRSICRVCGLNEVDRLIISRRENTIDYLGALEAGGCQLEVVDWDDEAE